MSIQIIITAESAEQVQEHILGLSGMMNLPKVTGPILKPLAAVDPATIFNIPANTPAATKTKKDKPAAVNPEPTEDAPATQPEQAEEIDDVALRSATSGKATTKEAKVAIKALLTKYGVEAVTKIPQDQRAAYLADLNAL